MSRKAFISHTSLIADWPSRDNSFLKAAIDGIREADWSYEEMEAFPASHKTPLGECLEKVARCDAYLGILGWDWGAEPPERQGVSYTKCEFEAAKDRIPTLFFIADVHTHAFPAGLIAKISDGDRQKQDLFRKEAQRLHAKTFVEPHELRREVAKALRALDQGERVSEGRIGTELIQAQENPITVTIGVPGFCDTSVLAACRGMNLFSRHGIEARIEIVKWHEQIDRLRVMRSSRKAVDVAFAVLSEIVESDSLSREYGSQNLFFLPTWEFVGMGFYCRNDIATPDELGFADHGMQAVREFLSQLKDKWILLPQATVYEHILRMLAQRAEIAWSDLNIANTTLEGAVGIAPKRPSVGLIGVPQVRLVETDMHAFGFKMALEQRHLGSIVTGLAANHGFRSRPDILYRIALAWYDGVGFLSKDPRAVYRHARKHIHRATQEDISFEEWIATLEVSRMPLNPSEARSRFFDPASSVFWRDRWDQLSESMALENFDDIPKDQSAVVADRIISMLLSSHPGQSREV